MPESADDRSRRGAVRAPGRPAIAHTTPARRPIFSRMPLFRIDHLPSLKAAMTPFPHSVRVDEPLGRAREMMAAHGIRHLPVTGGGRLVGLVTERDLNLLAGFTPTPRERDDLLVRDACVLDAYVVDIDAPLSAVLRELAERHIGSALVTRHEKLVGIFTVTDACRAFGELLAGLEPGGDDEAA